MDQRVDIWNILHDGQITAVEGEDGETVTMVVSIPYLRRRLEPVGDSFVLTLAGVTCLEFHDFDRGTTPLRRELDRPLEILRTESESMPIGIETTLGRLILDFQSITIALDTGEPVELEAVEKACEDYWTELAPKDLRGLLDWMMRRIRQSD